VRGETSTKAVKGAFFVHVDLTVEKGATKEWITVAEVDQSVADVIDLSSWLNSESDFTEEINLDVIHGTENLEKLVGMADGIQKGQDKLTTARHYSNVLFNIMRGGIFENQYDIDRGNLRTYVQSVHPKFLAKNMEFFDSLPDQITYPELVHLARESGDANVLRICTEYLPLSFSRRHGDPSRPWNYFSIDLTDEKNNKLFHYEGNWRDIFQNWEALAYAFPEFIEGMITKFVNASTIDGYNPYRITSEGIDWEVIEPEDPWSYIGYWGDHQIIYLQKLLEHAERHYPGKLKDMLTQRNFVYANVPYRIKSFAAIKENPNDTIVFDYELAAVIDERCNEYGADGKLIWKNGQLLQANFAEKLLVMALTKLYNFVPDGGVWMNTQRPEWNDANNALVGKGLSMVTLNYLRRFLVFATRIFEELPVKTVELNAPVADLLFDLHSVFTKAPKEFSPAARHQFMDELGLAGEKYRNVAYQFFNGITQKVNVETICQLFQSSAELAESAIHTNKRSDGLFHAYNLLEFDEEGAKISHLYEMLEGQVAVLSSGVLDAHEAVIVLDALKSSSMYRPNQNSYMLYPDRILKPFISKNTIPEKYVSESLLFQHLIQRKDTCLVEADKTGGLHFAGGIHNAADVLNCLTELEEGDLKELVITEREMILSAFEEVFQHVSFTGRSGTFFGYEGLGSVYWHMVSKLLLAVQENVFAAVEKGVDESTIRQLLHHYNEIRDGIGINKSPKIYGAFPTDAYSHTPAHAGAQQPGLTGQVKEDVINRWAVLGIQVRNGRICIEPFILKAEELMQSPEKLNYIDVEKEYRSRIVNEREMAFTYCGTLFTYVYSPHPRMQILLRNGEVFDMENLVINEGLSSEIFMRSGLVKEVRVSYPIGKMYVNK
jgi:hypothetical protein